MRVLYKIILRILVIVVVLIAFNLIYKSFFYERDLQQYSQIINLVRAVPDDVDILYIGESSNTAFSENDWDRRSISSFISDFYPDLKLSSITKPAAHAGTYEVLLENIPKNSKLGTVIVTLNLRSFNTQWIHSKLETGLQKSIVLLKDMPPLVNRFLLSFKAYEIKTNEEREAQIMEKWEEDLLKFPYDFAYDNIMEWNINMEKKGIRNSDGSRNQKLTDLACHFIKGYAFQIDTLKNPRIRDFNKIIGLANERGWNLVFNLLAENTEKAKELVGNDLIFLMEQNRILLLNYFQNRGVIVVDNFNAVKDEEFIDQNWTTEHYVESGRSTIALNVADSIKKFYPENYVKIEQDIKLDEIVQGEAGVFFNDGRPAQYWKQAQSLTKENAFSPPYSSKTGNGNDFSLTFEYPLNEILESGKNYININLKIFQNSGYHNANLAIEAQGGGIEYFWDGIPLSEHLKEIEVWEDVNILYKIPQKIKQGELLKIYVYNTSDEIVFVDDIKIQFE